MKNKLTQNRSGVLLEEMNSKIDIILEGHAGLDNRIKDVDKKIDVNHKEFKEFRKDVNFRFDDLREEMNLKFDEVNSNFKTIFGYLSKIDDNLQELQFIKSELAQIKSKLSKKADLDYIEKLEQRVNKIEMDYVELRVMVKAKK